MYSCCWAQRTELTDRILDNSVSVRHPLVLSQRFKLRRDQQRFHGSSFFRGIFEDVPSVCAIAPPLLGNAPQSGSITSITVPSHLHFGAAHGSVSHAP